MVTFQALVYDPRGANNKRQFIEIWLDHYMSEPNTFFVFRPAQMPPPPKESIQSSENSSQRPPASTPSLSSRLDAGTKTVRSGVKRVASAAKINTQPLKRTKRAVSNSSSRAEIDAEADTHSPNGDVSSARKDTTESIEVSSAGSNELDEELGKSHNTSFRSLLVTSFSSQG